MSVGTDEDWLDALAGRKPGQPLDERVNAAVFEGLALRTSIAAVLRADPQAAQQGEAATESIIDADREIALIARARAHGLLSPDRPKNPNLRRSEGTAAWSAQVPRLGFAVVLLAAVSVGLWTSFHEPVIAVRGAQTGTVRLRDRNPGALQRQLEQELGAAGVPVTGFSRLGRVGIDADLPVPVPAVIALILARHHLPIPADGVLSVEIDAAVP